ncbi:zonular occludens toxin family protein [Methylophilus sp.]|uniref:zonular occludens toxin family protein n=1 Tax=Methylophilus sp. TaxID=29541 RepID=UPI0040359DA6
MITIITGVPGMGKTALLVQMLLANDKASNARPVFVMGIPDLRIEHVKAPPVEEWTEKRPDPDDPSLMLDYFTFPPNSYLILDEAQRVYRPRSAGTKVPPYVAALETHRHTGLDIILLTQKPNLVDVNVRHLCGRHIHIRDTILGRKLYEWPEYNDTDNKANLDAAAKRAFKPPKESFKYYKSSEMHTKQPRRFHQVWIYLALAVVFMGYMGYRAFTSISGRMSDKPIQEAASSAPSKAGTDSKKPRRDLIDGELHESPGAQEYSGPDPAFNVSNDIHPYSGFTFVLVGSVKGARKEISYYRLFNGEYGFTATSDELQELGYSVKVANNCTSYLIYEKAKIVAICALPQDPQKPQTIEAKAKDTLGDIRGRQPPDADNINLDSRSWDTYHAPSPATKY